MKHAEVQKNPYSGIHEEFVKVLQGVSTLYRFGSDRVRNADAYCRKHAKAMASFDDPELHPETRRMYRNLANEHLSSEGMMELTACRDCGKPIKITANQCPHCSHFQ
jgi:hypothetical protein